MKLPVSMALDRYESSCEMAGWQKAARLDQATRKWERITFDPSKWKHSSTGLNLENAHDLPINSALSLDCDYLILLSRECRIHIQNYSREDVQQHVE